MLEIYIHLLWIILFGLNLLATIVINCTILSYLKEKPLGRQTLFDLMVCDMILVLLLTICFYTFIVYIRELIVFLPELESLLSETFCRVTSIFNFFTYSLALMSMTATFFVRTVSITLSGSYDDAVSDDVIVLTFKSGALLTSGGVALYELIAGGVGLSGPYFFLLGKSIPEGFSTLGDLVISCLLFVQMIVFVAMQVIVEVQKRKLRKAQVAPASHVNVGLEVVQISDDFGDTRILAIITAIMITITAMVQFHFDTSELKKQVTPGVTLLIIFVMFNYLPMRLVLRNPNMKKFAVAKVKVTFRKVTSWHCNRIWSCRFFPRLSPKVCPGPVCTEA